MAEPVLRIGHVIPRSEVNGPGARFTLWLQGCHLDCPGCFNPQLHDPRQGRAVPAADLLRQILATPGIEGVTFSGGEPFLQAGALATLAARLQDLGLSVMSYSGFTRRFIETNLPHGRQLLAHLDILIDGPYLEAQRAPLRWRGSRNQTVHFLTSRYRHLATETAHACGHEVEIQIGETGVAMTGVFETRIWTLLAKRLRLESSRHPDRSAPIIRPGEEP